LKVFYSPQEPFILAISTLSIAIAKEIATYPRLLKEVRDMISRFNDVLTTLATAISGQKWSSWTVIYTAIYTAKNP
jgi:hypothetical protein